MSAGLPSCLLSAQIEGSWWALYYYLLRFTVASRKNCYRSFVLRRGLMPGFLVSRVHLPSGHMAFLVSFCFLLFLLVQPCVLNASHHVLAMRFPWLCQTSSKVFQVQTANTAENACINGTVLLICCLWGTPVRVGYSILIDMPLT